MGSILERRVTGDRRRATGAVGTPSQSGAVAGQDVGTLYRLEGRRVCIALKDGTRLEGCTLVSAGRRRTRTIWLVVAGSDAFVALDDVVDVWEAAAEAHEMSKDPSLVNPLAGSPMHVAVDVVLVERAGRPVLFAGRTPDGQRWLVARGPEAAGQERWLCAPASDVAIACVASGRARPADVLRHSATGTVTGISVRGDGTFSESVRLCASLRDDELPG